MKHEHWLIVNFLLLGLLACGIGCGQKGKIKQAQQTDSPKTKVTQARPLSILVIGLPDFGDEVVRQWSAKRDGELTIKHLEMKKFEQMRRESGNLDLGADFDLLVFPASINADLYEADLIREVPKDVMDDELLNRNGVLRQFRRAFVRHDNTVRSISLGGVPPVLLYRKDVLEKLELGLPETWKEFSKVTARVNESIGDFEGLESAFAMPTSEGWAARMFFARAGSEIRSRGKLTTCFDRKSMKGLLTKAPFVKALNDLKSLAGKSSNGLSAEQVFQQFAQGKTAFVFTTPVVTESLSDAEIESSANWAVAPLPGTREFFDLKEDRWQRRRQSEPHVVNSLEFDVFNIAVSKRTAKSKDAFDFAVWLVEKRISGSLLRSVTGPFRAAHLGRIDRWLNLEDVDRDFQDALSEWQTAMHDEKVVFMFPQILRRSDYVGALDERVASFLSGESKDADAILAEVVTRWDELTQEIGAEAQLKHLSRTSGL